MKLKYLFVPVLFWGDNAYLLLMSTYYANAEIKFLIITIQGVLQLYIETLQHCSTCQNKTNVIQHLSYLIPFSVYLSLCVFFIQNLDIFRIIQRKIMILGMIFPIGNL